MTCFTSCLGTSFTLLRSRRERRGTGDGVEGDGRSGSAGALVVAGTILMLRGPAHTTGNLESTQISFSNEAKLGPQLTDGARLYFESGNVPSAMSVTGGMIAPIPGLSGGMYLVDVLADGSKVLVWAQNLNNEVADGRFLAGSSLGGAWRKIGTEQEANPIARWSSDGKSIYFVEGKQVWVMDEDGGDARALWKPPQPPFTLAVSPDGKQLAVTVLSRTARIWLVGSDGNDPHPLKLDWPADAAETQGQWTPDGRRFLFNSDREGRGNVYELVKPLWFEFWKKPEAMRLTGNQLNITDATPARDSKSIYVLGRVESGAMQVFDPRAGKLVPFLGGLPASDLVVSPDRQWMAYTEYPSGHLWKSRVDGRQRGGTADRRAGLDGTVVPGRKVSAGHGARAAADGDLLRGDETVADTDVVRRAGRLLCLVSRQSRHLLLADPNPCRYVPAVGTGRRAAACFGHSRYDDIESGVRERDGGRTAGDHELRRSRAGVLAAVEVSGGPNRQSGWGSLLPPPAGCPTSRF